MQRKSKVYIALLHYPMRNRRGDIIATSITNLDLHDIARAARTYEVDGFFVLHPAAYANYNHLSVHSAVSITYWARNDGAKVNFRN